jgi:hypothetical protein
MPIPKTTSYLEHHFGRLAVDSVASDFGKVNGICENLPSRKFISEGEVVVTTSRKIRSDV